MDAGPRGAKGLGLLESRGPCGEGKSRKQAVVKLVGVQLRWVLSAVGRQVTSALIAMGRDWGAHAGK